MHCMLKMTPLRLRQIIQFLSFFLAVYTALAAQIACVKEYYGAPSPRDCDELLESFADGNDNQPRFFDEEQLRIPGGLNFPGVQNVYPTQVVQVPAYWSLGKFIFLTYDSLFSISLIDKAADWW